jgi:hypothetical protein
MLKARGPLEPDASSAGLYRRFTRTPDDMFRRQQHESQEAKAGGSDWLRGRLRGLPKLKASDYDYIIFDLPPASLTSATPRLASHTDITLLVVESEKTGQQVAARAKQVNARIPRKCGGRVE